MAVSQTGSLLSLCPCRSTGRVLCLNLPVSQLEHMPLTRAYRSALASCGRLRSHMHCRLAQLHHHQAQHLMQGHSTAQRSAAQHSTAQHSTAQHSTAQHIAAPAVNVAGRWAIILGEGHNPGALVSSLAYNAEFRIFNLLQLLEVFSQSGIQDVPFPPQVIEAHSLDFSACSHTSSSISAGEQHQTVHVCHQVSLPQRNQTQISAGSTMQMDSGI